MATVYGESGAWADVLDSLRAEKLFVSHPRELPVLLETHKKQHRLGVTAVQEEFERELKKISVRRQTLIEEFPANVVFATKAFNRALEPIAAERNQLYSRPFLRNLLTGFFPIILLEYRHRRLHHKKAYAINLLHQDIQKQQDDYLYRQNNRERLIQEKFNKIERNISFLEQVQHSQEVAGALAELEVIECLKMLPKDYHVCNNVHLRAHRKIRFDGAYLRSAQIDHLVVGPSGVFVIEVKRWSREFINQQNYFDPFQQVARASYLCYDILRDAFPGRRVQSIIVNCGNLPPCSQKHRVKVVTLPELRGYITWRHQPELNSETVSGVLELLYEI